MSPDQKKLQYVEPQIPENTIRFNASLCIFYLQTVNVTPHFRFVTPYKNIFFFFSTTEENIKEVYDPKGGTQFCYFSTEEKTESNAAR